MALIGAGIVCAGLSIFFWLGCKAITQGAMTMTKKMVIGMKNRLIKKEEGSMKEYEIVLNYLNGCAGAAYPLTSFEEAALNCPADYIRNRLPFCEAKPGGIPLLLCRPIFRTAA